MEKKEDLGFKFFQEVRKRVSERFLTRRKFGFLES